MRRGTCRTVTPAQPHAWSLRRALDRPARSVRRLLSGDDAGTPDFVRRMALPGDAGIFGPSSVVWQVHGSTATLVGGVRALILQALQPSALAGVERHSRFREDPIGRLRNTARFVTVVTYGSTEQVAEECAMVRRVHDHVRGVDPLSGPYDASDPVLLRYVHLSLVDSFLVAFQRYSGRPLTGEAADEYVREMNRLAPLLGFDTVPLPQSVGEMQEMLTPSAAGLFVTASTVTTLRFLAAPPLPRSQRFAYPLLLRAASVLLPEQTAALLPSSFVRPTSFPARQAATLSGRALVGLLAVMLGESPAVRLANLRLAAIPDHG